MRSIALFAVVLGLLWLAITTGVVSSGRTEYEIHLPQLLGGWGVIAIVILFLVKLEKRRRSLR